MVMLPEIILIVSAFFILIIDLFISKERRSVILTPLALLALLGSLIVLFCPSSQGELLGGRYLVTQSTWLFKVIFVMSALLTIGLASDQLRGRCKEDQVLRSPAEFIFLLFMTLIGMMYLISSTDLVSLYVSLELATIPLFALAAWRKGNIFSEEASIKFLISGALASAFLLYGFGFLYGLTGTTDLVAIASIITEGPTLWLAIALVIAGVGFKLTLTPFHMWAPDVYQGSPTPLTAYLSVASKAAAVAMMFQVFFKMLEPSLESLGWLFALIATMTMTLGNAVAIVQSNIKRFMAYSAISQAGYLMMGFLSFTDKSVAAIIFYLMVYIVSNITVFGVIILYSNATGKEQITDYKGLSKTHPLLALTMMLALFSLSGIPPLAGFVGKFFLFNVAASAGYYWLVGVAALNSTVSLYYYLRVVRQMYIEEPHGENLDLPMGWALKGTLALALAGTVLLGLVPQFYEGVQQLISQ